MIKSELKKLLVQNNVKTDSYSLDGGLPNEAFCLNKFSGVWEVYYSERGCKSGLKEFNSEDEACKYLYKLMLQDSAVFPRSSENQIIK